jgi:hypothetical protein
MILGGVLAAIAFFISGVVELQLQASKFRFNDHSV